MKKSSKKVAKKATRGTLIDKKDSATTVATEPVKQGRGRPRGSGKTDETAPAVAEPLQKRQDGIHNFKETEEDAVQVVRGAFLLDTFKAKITFAFQTITFNTACVNLFPGDQYVTLRIDVRKRRLFVMPTVYYDDNSLKFANFKESRNVPRPCTTKFFCPMLFEFMKWDPNAKYRIQTIYQEFGDKKIMVFNLDDSIQVFSETITSEDGTKKRTSSFKLPLAWKDRFGHTVDELAEKRRIDFRSEVIVIDNKTGEKRVGYIESKPPTEEELIHEQYGGIRPRKEVKKDE
jgi:hypothetical protein